MCALSCLSYMQSMNSNTIVDLHVAPKHNKNMIW